MVVLGIFSLYAPVSLDHFLPHLLRPTPHFTPFNQGSLIEVRSLSKTVASLVRFWIKDVIRTTGQVIILPPLHWFFLPKGSDDSVFRSHRYSCALILLGFFELCYPANHSVTWSQRCSFPNVMVKWPIEVLFLYWWSFLHSLLSGASSHALILVFFKFFPGPLSFATLHSYSLSPVTPNIKYMD